MNVLLLAAVLTVSPSAEPQFGNRVEVKGLSLDVYVTDKQGRFVSGLNVDAFELLEDGKPQHIDAVREIHHPRPTPSDAREADAILLERFGTVEAIQARRAELPTRHFVFAYDLASGVGQKASRDTMRWAAQNLLPEDRITIVTLHHRLRVLIEDQPFDWKKGC